MKVLWLAGWASDLSLWENNLKLRFPQHQHSFLNFVEASAFHDFHSYDVCIFWSLAAHFSPEATPDTHFLFINPALQFCSPPYGWNKRHLDRMISGIQKDPKTVLKSFAKQLGLNENDESTWISRALLFSTEDLITGLLTLRDKAGPTLPSDSTIFVGEKDAITPLSHQEKLWGEIKVVPLASHFPIQEVYLKEIEVELAKH